MRQGGRRFPGALAPPALIVASWSLLAAAARHPGPAVSGVVETLFTPLVLLSAAAVPATVILAADHRRRAAVKAFAAGVSALAAILLFELAAASALVHWRALLQRVSGHDSSFVWAFRIDPETAFSRRPNDRWTSRSSGDIEPDPERKTNTFTYDARGFRNPKDLERAPIVLIGDSYVEGAYVSDEETVARRLEELLGKPVANLATAGYGPRQELIILRKHGLELEPETVVWFFFEGNDIYDDADFSHMIIREAEAPVDGERLQAGFSLLHNWRDRSFTLSLLHQLRNWSEPLIPRHHPHTARFTAPGHSEQEVVFEPYGGLPWTDYEEDCWAGSRAALIEAVDLARVEGFELLFVFVPTKYRVLRPYLELEEHNPVSGWAPWDIDERFRSFCDSQGLSCIDLTPRFQAALSEEGRFTYFTGDGHWNPAGHELAARAVRQALMRTPAPPEPVP